MTTKAHTERGILLTLALIQFTHIVDFMVIMPLGPHFLQSLHIKTQQFSTLVSAYTISAGVSGFIASFILDNMDRKRALLIALTGFTVGTLLCALSKDYWMLLFSRVVTGSFGGVLAALILAILGDTIPPQKRGKAMGIVMSSFSLASIFGVPFGLFLANRFDWAAPFYFLAGLSVIIVTLTVKMIPKTPMSKPVTSSQSRQFRLSTHIDTLCNRLRNKNQLIALSLIMILMLGQFSLIPLISTFMVTNVGFSFDQLTYIYMLGGIASFLSSQISGRLSDKVGQKRLFLVASLLCIIPAIGITHLTRQNLVIPLVFTTLLFIFSSARMVAAMSLILSTTTLKNRAGFMSLHSCVQQISAGVAAFVASLIVTQSPVGELLNYSKIGYLAATTSTLVIFIAFNIKPATHPDEADINEQEMTELRLS